MTAEMSGRRPRLIGADGNVGPDGLLHAWQDAWPHALLLWSRFTRLKDPVWCFTQAEEAAAGLTGSFAMIRLNDHSVVISLRQIAERGLGDLAVEILAHEIGHHILTPADPRDHVRMLARMQAPLGHLARHAGMVANLYTDLLINDRLERIEELRMAEVYRRLKSHESGDDLWLLYMRLYEDLWRLPTGTLSPPMPKGAEKKRPHLKYLDLDVRIGARIVRTYARDWLNGAASFAALAFPYLVQSVGDTLGRVEALMDTAGAAEGAEPAGLAEMDDGEAADANPREDPRLNGTTGAGEKDDEDKNHGGRGGNTPERGSSAPRQTRYRPPTQYADLLKAAGVKLTPEQAIIRYYRERAAPHLVPFPEEAMPQAADPLPEGLTTWELGGDMSEIDWPQTAIQGPVIVPGVTTVERVHGDSPGADPARRPLDLFIGVDCSGSMINPARNVSYPVIGGAILGLSALRVGARVMVTLSGEHGGKGKHSSTEAFITDARAVMATLTDYLGTGSAFGLRHLITAFPPGRRVERPAHIVIVTDDDIFRHLDGEGPDASDPTGWDVARTTLARAGGGGTLILHSVRNKYRDKDVARLKKDGWDIEYVRDWEEVIDFARAFARRTYARKDRRSGGQEGGRRWP